MMYFGRIRMKLMRDNCGTLQLTDLSIDNLSAADINQRFLVVDFLGMYYLLEDKYAERALQAGVNAVNVTFGGEGTWDTTLKSFDSGLEKIEKSNYLTLATEAEHFSAAQKSGRLAIVIGTQGASMIGEELWRVRVLHRLGLRVLGLNGSFGNLYGAGSAERHDGGLTFLGLDLIEAVNEVGLLLDLSHCGHRTTAEAIKTARAPICSHANAFTVEPTDRNRRDDELLGIAAKGGTVGVCALPRAVKEHKPGVKDIADHVDYMKSLIGPESIGIGLDIMEGYRENKTSSPGMMRRRTLRPDIFGTVDDYYNDDIPHGLNSIQQLPNLTELLVERGYSASEIAGILGRNWLRSFERFIG